jgi:hypothetical protein
VAHIKPSDGSSTATQCKIEVLVLIVQVPNLFLFMLTWGSSFATVAAHLTTIHSAVKMLNSRMRVLHHYLVSIQKGIL